MIDLPTASLAIVLLNAGEGNIGRRVSPVVPFIKVGVLLSPRRKIRIIIHLFTSGSSSFALYVEVCEDLHQVDFGLYHLYRKKEYH